MSEVTQLASKNGFFQSVPFIERLNQACPLARVNGEFSPERILKKVQQDPDALLSGSLIWECLTCGLCRVITEGSLDMSSFIREVRAQAVSRGFLPRETHGGMMLSMQRMSTLRGPVSQGESWIDKPLRIRRSSGTYLYWAGGAPFYDAAFPDLGPRAVDSARAAVLLLNRLGVEPVILEPGRFSGHDLLWTGDLDGFHTLARRNIEEVENTGAQVVIVSSPEDYYTIGKSYTELFGAQKFRVVHITEFVAQHLGELSFREKKIRLTYQDPCRLGRGMGVYDAPRDILAAIPGIELVEMQDARQYAQCCGTSCWTNCTRFSKLMQVKRLQEARETQAAALVTACWECAVHFSCALRPEAWRQLDIELCDLVTLAASQLLE
jgi:heterodisulfide reductase subunit D